MEMSSRRTANSSPPSLATVSLARVHSKQPTCDLDEYGVTRGVAVAVVDRLERVEVEEEQRHPDLAAPGPVQGVRHAVEQDATVGQVGERVVTRVVDHVGGQLDPGEGIGAEDRQGTERLLVGAAIVDRARSRAGATTHEGPCRA